MARTSRTTKKSRFLEALRSGMSITAAAEAIRVGRRTVYDWRDADPDFAAAWDEAIEDGTDRLEDEAWRRAFAGSDTLLIFLLKARRPHKYRDNHRVEHDGGVRVEVITSLPDPEDG